MFISNNTVIVTENGTKLASSDFSKIYSIDGFSDITKNNENQESIFIKTELFPTITSGNDSKILAGRLMSTNNNLFIKNDFYKAADIREGDYIFISPINYETDISFNRTLVWLYAKYLVSGYYCTESQTNEPMIIIKPKRFSKKESLKLRNIEGVSYNLDKNIIVIKNKNIIKDFGTKKTNLSWKIYGCSPNLIQFFLHTIEIEHKNIQFESKTIVFDIFMISYIKLNKVLKITEVNSDKGKVFILNDANPEEYLLVNDTLYARVTKILKGKKVKGISIENPENKPFCTTFLLMK